MSIPRSEVAIKEVRLPFARTQILSLQKCIKRVTRRPVRDELQYLGQSGRDDRRNWTDPTLWGMVDDAGEILTLGPVDPSDDKLIRHRLGKPGDTLVCTETWRPEFSRRHGACVRYRADDALCRVNDEAAAAAIKALIDRGRGHNWRPPRFMPAAFARLRRTIISITPQRLYQIAGSCRSECAAEVTLEGIGWPSELEEPDDYFMECWDEMYAATFPSYSDPWLRRVEFE